MISPPIDARRRPVESAVREAQGDGGGAWEHGASWSIRQKSPERNSGGEIRLTFALYISGWRSTFYLPGSRLAFYISGLRFTFYIAGLRNHSPFLGLGFAIYISRSRFAFYIPGLRFVFYLSFWFRSAVFSTFLPQLSSTYRGILHRGHFALTQPTIGGTWSSESPDLRGLY